MKVIWFFICHAIGGTIGARVKRASGGRSISIEDSPHFVSVRRDGTHVCGGALISTRHVLTAAHCLLPKEVEDLDNIRVVSGADKLYGLGVQHRVHNISVHHGYLYMRKPSCNIAVVTLLFAVQESAKQKAIDLPNAEMPLGELAYFTAFQLYKTKATNRHLQILTIRMVAPTKPSDMIDNHDNVLYGYSRYSSISNGDLGGPLTYGDKIVGIAALTTSQQGRACYFINVIKFKPFIEESMGIDTSPKSQRSSVIILAPKRPRI